MCETMQNVMYKNMEYFMYEQRIYICNRREYYIENSYPTLIPTKQPQPNSNPRNPIKGMSNQFLENILSIFFPWACNQDKTHFQGFYTTLQFEQGKTNSLIKAFKVSGESRFAACPIFGITSNRDFAPILLHLQ